MRLLKAWASTIAIVSVCLTGCAHNTTEPKTVPPVVMPEDWRTPIDYRTAMPGEYALDRQWWKAFGDDTLSELVEKAQNYNAQIGIAAGRLRQARGSEQSVHGALLPSITGAGIASWSHTEIPIEILGVDFDVTSEGGSALPSVQMSYELDIFGRLSNQADAATLGRMGAAAQRDTIKLSVAAATATAYLQLLALDAQLRLLNQTLATRAESLRLQQRRYDTGYSSLLALRQAQIEYASTEQMIPATKLAIEQTENALSVLTGQPPGSIDRTASLSRIQIPVIPAIFPSELLRRRPDIASSEYSLVASDKSLEAARALFMPQVRLSTTGALLLSETFDDPVEIFSLGGSVLAPIFEGGRIAGQVEAAAGIRDQAAWAFRDTVLQALREVEDNLAAVRRQNEQYNLVSQQYELVSSAYDLAHHRYMEGYTSYLVELDVQRILFSSEQSLIQARLSKLQAIVNLYKAMGGGWHQDVDICEEMTAKAGCPIQEMPQQIRQERLQEFRDRVTPDFMKRGKSDTASQKASDIAVEP